MKDLYTFDYNVSESIKTYNSVKDAYVRLFNELKLPYLIAAADSGKMGGSLSHEFHFPSSKGEDRVISCSSCNHVFNEEVATGEASSKITKREPTKAEKLDSPGLGPHEALAISTGEWRCISKDRKTLVRAYYPRFLLQHGKSEPIQRYVNQHALRSIAVAHGIDLDLSVKDPLAAWKAEARGQFTDTEPSVQVLDVYDYRVRPFQHPPMSELLDAEIRDKVQVKCSRLDQYPGTGHLLDFIEANTGDECPKCSEPALETNQAVEIAHTFHLGTRYSEVLQAKVAIDQSLLGAEDTQSKPDSRAATLQMGCHGIGVSRMISAVADSLADTKGLKWPRAIAPFEAIIVPGKGLETESEQVYDAIAAHQGHSIDIILDDRSKGLAWKLGDADLIGYPIVMVLGKSWKSEGKVEVQCRRLDVRKAVSLDELPAFVASLLDKM